MAHYLDEYERPVLSPDGHTHCKAVETVDGLTIAVHYLESVPTFVTYEGLALDAVHAFHSRRHAGLPYQLHDAPWSYHFAPDGSLKYKDHTRTIGERAMIVEEWDANGKMMHGTTYLMADGEIQFAAEFGPERSYFNGFDFSTGDTLPIAELLARLTALGLV